MFGYGYAALRAISVEQHSQCEEQYVHRQEGNAVARHVLLCVAQVLARQVFLHHVLVKPGHDNNYEHSGQEFFPEKLSALPVVKYEYPSVRAVAHVIYHALRVETPLSGHNHQYGEQGHYQCQCLQRVGPHKSAYPAFAGVQPGEEQRNNYCNLIRYA